MRWFNAIGVCAGLTLVTCQRPLHGAERRIATIEFFGHKRLDVAAVRAALPFHEGDELPEIVLNTQAEPEFEPAPEPVAIAPVAIAPVAVARPRRQPNARSAPGSKGKAAFTLRLDASRHLKLRLACAVNGRSAQQLVTDAVDRLLAEMPELDSMAERAPTKRTQA